MARNVKFREKVHLLDIMYLMHQ